jgi:biopolymer transport protein TolR
VPKTQPTGGGSARLGRGRRVSSTLAEINVVPLVDVMLVLLIIFMVTAPMLQSGIPVRLPVARRASAVEAASITVTIRLSYRQDQIIYLGDEPLSSTVFQERIRQTMEGRTKKQVYLRGDRGIEYQDLMTVMSRLKDAGVEDVGLLATETER